MVQIDVFLKETLSRMYIMNFEKDRNYITYICGDINLCSYLLLALNSFCITATLEFSKSRSQTEAGKTRMVGLPVYLLLV